MTDIYYIFSFISSFVMVLILIPPIRKAALYWGVMDYPISAVKTHKTPTPYMGGVAIFMGITISLLLVRLFTNFPTGTLYSLRAIILGGGFIMLVGLVDDIKRGGLSIKFKFLFQIMGALLLLWFDIRIKFIQPDWLAYVLTIVWVVGITNTFNIIDIMDGLSSSQAFIACCGFLFISLPTEKIYVNFAAAAVAGACLGFIPYNMSEKRKIFMGDAGSMLLGFMMAALSLGTSYTRVNEVGLFAPLLILGLPLYDTFFVMVLRMQQGKSPFLGSKDHLALKLRTLGLSPKQVVLSLGSVAVFLCLTAYFVTIAALHVAVFIFAAAFVIGLYVIFKLHKVEVL